MSDTTTAGRLDQTGGDGDPQRGVLQGSRLSKADTARSFPRLQRATASPSSRRSSPDREDVFYEYAKNIEKAVADQPDCLAVLKLHYLRWILFPSRGDLLHVSGHLRHRLRQIHRGCCGALRESPASTPSSKTSRAFLRTGRRMLRRSSSSFASTSARASWNTVSIPT